MIAPQTDWQQDWELQEQAEIRAEEKRAHRAQVRKIQRATEDKLRGMALTERARDAETPEQTIARDANRTRDDGMRRAREILTGEKSLQGARTHSPAGVVLCFVQEQYLRQSRLLASGKAKHPFRDVPISFERFEKELRKNGHFKDKPATVRFPKGRKCKPETIRRTITRALTECREAGVLNVRQRDPRAPRYYMPLMPPKPPPNGTF